MLASLFDFIRDLAILAAAVGIARWAWDWHTSRTERRNDAAMTALADDRWRTDARRWAGRIENQLDELAGRQRDSEALTKAKVAIHKLLQSTIDPYLSFAEIEAALSRARSPEPAMSAAGETPVAVAVADTSNLAGDALRRVLIEMVGDGVIAQLDRDRYFIASDFEAGEGDTHAPG